MNKVIFQFWENSIESFDVIPDGCSIHIDEIEFNRWVDSIYSTRDLNDIPEEYDRVIGDKLIAFVEDDLFKKVENFKTIRLSQNQLNNLILMDEITIKE
jgi:hypothetical protein